MIENLLLNKDLDPLRDAARRFLTTQPVKDKNAKSLWEGVVREGWVHAVTDAEAPSVRILTMLNAELGRESICLPLAESVAPLLVTEVVPQDPTWASLRERAISGMPLAVTVIGGIQHRPDALLFNGPLATGWIGNVEHLSIATALIVIDDTSQRVAWCETPSDGMSLVPKEGFARDTWHDVTFTRASMWSGPSGSASRRLSQVIRLSAVARAWGAAERSVEELSDYVQVREQFGQVIGKFQSMQHRLANLTIALSASRALINRAAWSFDQNEQDWQAHTDAACSYAGSSLRRLALECQHGFGAVGYMEDHPMPHRFRRIHVDLVRHAAPGRAAADLAQRVLDAEDGAEFVTQRLSVNQDAELTRREVATWLDEHWNERKRIEHYSGKAPVVNFDKGFLKAIGERGFIGLTIPKLDGGMGRSALDQFAFDEEINFREAPFYSYATAQLLAPSLVKYGTETQRTRYLPLMLSGDAVFCLGYSEPNAGSDLASLKTSAIRVGDEWVINGAKIWTTLGTVGDYVWLAARTDPERPRHGGLSVFIVPLRAPGITIQPLRAMNGEHPCAVFYDEVHLPLDALIGDLNDGWAVITHALSQERMLMGTFASRLSLYLSKIIMELRSCASRTPGWLSQPGLRTRLGEIVAEAQACRLLALGASVIAAHGGKPIAQAAMSKIITGELQEQMSEAAMDWFGPDATLSQGCDGALLEGLIPHSLVMGIMYVVGGGANDIQRNIIAQNALGLPR